MYYSGQGKLYLAVRDTLTGKPQGFVPLGNCTAVELGLETEKIEHKESMSGQRATDLILSKSKKVTLKFTMEDITPANVARGFWGSVNAVAAAASQTALIKADLGKRMVLPYTNVSNIAVQSDDVTPVVYQFGAFGSAGAKNGYWDAAFGALHVFSAAEQTANGATASIAQDDILEVSYDQGAVTEVRAFTETSMERYLRFEGLNTVDGTAKVVEVYRASLDPVGAYGLINDELAALEVTGAALYDDLQVGDSKFFRELTAGAA